MVDILSHNDGKGYNYSMSPEQTVLTPGATSGRPASGGGFPVSVPVIPRYHNPAPKTPPGSPGPHSRLWCIACSRPETRNTPSPPPQSLDAPAREVESCYLCPDRISMRGEVSSIRLQQSSARERGNTASCSVVPFVSWKARIWIFPFGKSTSSTT